MKPIEILLLTFLILMILILFLIIAIYSIKFYKMHKSNVKSSFYSLKQDKALGILADTNSTISQKSYAMICLIVGAFILIHILINEGGDYDDKSQEDKFKKNIQGRRIFDDLNNSGIGNR